MAQRKSDSSQHSLDKRIGNIENLLTQLLQDKNKSSGVSSAYTGESSGDESKNENTRKRSASVDEGEGGKRKRSEGENFECTLCDGKFQKEWALFRHYRVKHREESPERVHQENLAKRVPVKKTHGNKPEKDMNCKLCEATFNSISARNNHYTSKHQIKDEKLLFFQNGSGLVESSLEQQISKNPQWFKTVVKRNMPSRSCKLCEVELDMDELKCHYEKDHKVMQMNKVKSLVKLNNTDIKHVTDTNSFENHEATVHSSSLIECKFCNKRLEKTIYNDHVMSEHQDVYFKKVHVQITPTKLTEPNKSTTENKDAKISEETEEQEAKSISTRRVSFKPQSTQDVPLLYICDACNLVTSSYDNVIVHSQDHILNNVTREPEICETCDLKFDVDFAIHKQMHLSNDDLDRDSFRLISYDFKNLTNDKWLDMFKAFSRSKVKRITSASIYFWTRCVRLMLLRDCKDASAQFTLFQCLTCTNYVDPKSIETHVGRNNACTYQTFSYQCVRCEKTFYTEEASDEHTKTHDVPDSDSRYRTVLFNDPSDFIFNKALLENAGKSILIEKDVSAQTPANKDMIVITETNNKNTKETTNDGNRVGNEHELVTDGANKVKNERKGIANGTNKVGNEQIGGTDRANNVANEHKGLTDGVNKVANERKGVTDGKNKVVNENKEVTDGANKNENEHKGLKDGGNRVATEDKSVTDEENKVANEQKRVSDGANKVTTERKEVVTRGGNVVAIDHKMTNKTKAKEGKVADVYKCACGLCFDRFKFLLTHMQDFSTDLTVNMKFTCSCGLVFDRKNLNYHIKVHCSDITTFNVKKLVLVDETKIDVSEMTEEFRKHYKKRLDQAKDEVKKQNKINVHSKQYENVNEQTNAPKTQVTSKEVAPGYKDFILTPEVSNYIDKSANIHREHQSVHDDNMNEAGSEKNKLNGASKKVQLQWSGESNSVEKIVENSRNLEESGSDTIEQFKEMQSNALSDIPVSKKLLGMTAKEVFVDGYKNSTQDSANTQENKSMVETTMEVELNENANTQTFTSKINNEEQPKLVHIKAKQINETHQITTSTLADKKCTKEIIEDHNKITKIVVQNKETAVEQTTNDDNNCSVKSSEINYPNGSDSDKKENKLKSYQENKNTTDIQVTIEQQDEKSTSHFADDTNIEDYDEEELLKDPEDEVNDSLLTDDEDAIDSGLDLTKIKKKIESLFSSFSSKKIKQELIDYMINRDSKSK